MKESDIFSKFAVEIEAASYFVTVNFNARCYVEGLSRIFWLPLLKKDVNETDVLEEEDARDCLKDENESELNSKEVCKYWQDVCQKTTIVPSVQ